MEAVRWGMFAKRLTPMLASHRAVLNTKIAGLSPRAKGEAYAAVKDAERYVAVLEEALCLGGGDGD